MTQDLLDARTKYFVTSQPHLILGQPPQNDPKFQEFEGEIDEVDLPNSPSMIN